MKLLFKKNPFYKWVVNHFPKDFEEMFYVEPYATNVLLNKPQSKEEVINDTDKQKVTILKKIRDNCDDLLTEIKKNQNNSIVSELLKYNEANQLINNLPRISERLQGVFIINKPIKQLIEAYNVKETLLYSDFLTDDMVPVVANFKGKIVLGTKPNGKGWKSIKKDGNCLWLNY